MREGEGMEKVGNRSQEIQCREFRSHIHELEGDKYNNFIRCLCAVFIKLAVCVLHEIKLQGMVAFNMYVCA